MPHAYEISDLQIFHFYKYKPAQFVEQVMDHFELLYRGGNRRAARIVAPIAAALDQRRAASYRRRRHCSMHLAPGEVWSAARSGFWRHRKAQQ